MTNHPAGGDDSRDAISRPAPTPELRSLPGRARPRKEVLRKVEEANAELRERLPSALWPLMVTEAEQYYRWRVQLDCGCVDEVLTLGEERLPSERQWRGPEHEWLQKGQMVCVHDDAPPAPYRDIAEWGERREVTFPADPVEPDDGMDPQTWAVLRHDEPHTSAFWKVTLACGHITDTIAPDLGWKPEDGPRLCSVKRVAEMTKEWEEYWASNPTEQSPREREHMRRMLSQRWPTPEPECRCYTCCFVHWIVAYQRVGWLVPRKAAPKRRQSPKPPSRAALQRRLQQAEAEAERLRSQLADLDQ
ncbi:hypothetical protein H9Y04_17265 [Streptomyces sp. TRM66268-LWL]|uniref:Uncharacterized protein n=1 Tax=Streptomyces polyasparticus TaxID=2767826 RepID=A0ABR7SIA1_9ACTN|nr:hypothetical protein [Streptomyces polyasparticus]MBC9714312.1 hypothetical protein [Streptomyces polyasparticus]